MTSVAQSPVSRHVIVPETDVAARREDLVPERLPRIESEPSSFSIATASIASKMMFAAS